MGAFHWGRVYYGPGVCQTERLVAKSKGGRYALGHVYGLHIYRSLRKAKKHQRGLVYSVIVPVTFHINDVLAVDREQVAVKKLVITQQAWKDAGFQPKTEKKRYI